MTIYFLTGNKNKLKEVQAIIPEIEGVDINLPEIQSLDAHEIIQEKLKVAFEHRNGEFIVEDTSLYIDGLKGLPGPLIKWFLETVGNEGLVTMSQAFNSEKVEAKTIIGYAKNKNDISFYEGVISGKIVQPRGSGGFGWGSIFVPDGYNQTFAEMSREEKNSISMRKIAVEKLKEFID